ncbi:hypothetical protein [Paenibacillus terrae]|nr:hypothetical protein [Paenibacillus terrae]
MYRRGVDRKCFASQDDVEHSFFMALISLYVLILPEWLGKIWTG